MSDNWTGTNGTLSGDWNNSANWSAGVPGTADTAFFETGSSIPYTVSGPGTPAEVVVQGDQVTISGSIAPAGTLGLDIEGGGALTVASGAAFSDPAGAIDVGASSAGTLIDDGLVSSYVLDIGREGTTGSGTVTVSGSAASLTVSTGLYMEGGSTLNIAGGATATTGFASIGLGSVNNLLGVSGLGSTLNATGGSGLNVLGGTLDVTNGGTVLASAGGIGIGDGSPGGGTLALDDSAQVSGALFLSEATLTALNAIGQSGTGTASLSGAVGLGIGGSDVLQATALTALDLGGNVSGASGLDVAGGAVRLGGADDTYSGGTTLFAGTFDSANTTGAGTGTIAFNAPGTTGLPGPTAGLRFYAGDATLRIESGGTLANAILLGSEIVTLSGTIATGTVAGAVGTIETASGAAVTLAGSIADFTGTVFANGTSTVETVPGTLVAGGGDLVLADAANSYSGGTTIDAGTLELKQPGVAGSGQISFAPHAGATLKLDGTVLPGNAIAGFAPGDTIDLANETVSSATFRNGTLTLDNASSLVGTLALAETNAVSPFVVGPDGTGGTDISAGFAWDQPAGGAFGTGGNWTPAGPPGTADYAFFDTGATAPYTVSGDGTPGDIEVDGDQVTLSGSLAPQGVAPLNVPDIGVLFPLVQIEQGGVLTVAAGATISNPTQGGAVFVGGDGSGTLSTAGLVDTGNSNAEIGGDAVFSAAGDPGGNITGPGLAVVSGPSAAWNLFELDVGAGQLNGSGTVSIADGGRISDTNGLIGRFAGGTVTVTGPGSGWVNQSLTLDRTDAVLNITNGGSVGAGTLDFGVANQFFGGTVALDDTATLTGGIIMANGLLEAIDAPGQSGAGTVTLDNAIELAVGTPAPVNEVEGTGHTALDLAGTIAGSGTLTAAGGDVILAGPANTYSGGTTIDAGTLELAAAGAGGSGDIAFQAGKAGTLRIDGSADLPANTIDGFAGGDLIDLPFLAYGPATATVEAGTLTVSGGTGTVTLNVSGIASGTTLVTAGDGSGGTDITALAGAAAATATGDTVLDGTATNRTETDQITVYGPLNTIDTFGGNEIITGGSMASTGVDDASYIHIGSTPGVAPPSNAGVTDLIGISGGNNTLTGDGTLGDEARSFVAGHTVTVPVANFTTATVSFVVSGQYSTVGGDYAGIDNTGGTNTVSVDGPSDVLYVNDAATSTITTGPTAGYTYLYMDSPEIGSPENLGAGYGSTITMGGNGNYVFGAEANHTVTIGGTVNGTVYGNNDDVTLGNGNNTVGVTGTANQIILGSGNDTVDAGTGQALVALEFFGRGNGSSTDAVTLGGGFNQVYAPQTETLILTGAPLGNSQVGPFVGGGATYTADGTDSVTLGGGSNRVVLGNGNDTVSLAGSAGGNVVSLGNGSDTVTVGGASNAVTVGNGNDGISANGDTATITGGNGNDTIAANGNFDTIVLGSGNDSLTAAGGADTITVAGTAASHDTLTIGSLDGGSVTNGVDAIALGNTDTFNLTSLEAGSTLMLGSSDLVFLNANADAKATFGGSGDTLTINGSSSYTGQVELTNFGTFDTLDLEGLTGANGQRIDSLANFDANLHPGGGSSTLMLLGGGKVTFDLPVNGGFTTADLKFS